MIEILLGIITTIHTVAIPWAAKVMHDIRSIRKDIEEMKTDHEQRIEANAERIDELKNNGHAKNPAIQT